MYRVVKIFVFCVVLFISVASCNKDENTEEQEPKYSPVQILPVNMIQSNLIAIGQSKLADEAKYGVSVYKFTYPVNYNDQEITASGLMAFPNNAGEYPLLSFQHGTMVAKNEAPTANIFNSMLYTSIASFGYVVVVPDLIGFGNSQDYFHPYLIKAPNVAAISNMIQGVKNIPASDVNGASANDSLFLIGYSQGGWLTLAQHEYMEKTDDLGMQLIASSCGAGPYNPELVMQYTMQQQTYEKPYYLAYVLLSFIKNGDIENDLDIYFQEPYASEIPNLFNGTNSGDQIDAALTQNIQDLYQPDLLTNYNNQVYDDLRQALDANRIHAWNNQAPILFTHGEADRYIPPMGTDSIFQEFLNAGSNLNSMTMYPELDHNTAAIPAIVGALYWFDALRIKKSIIAKK